MILLPDTVSVSAEEWMAVQHLADAADFLRSHAEVMHMRLSDGKDGRCKMADDVAGAVAELIPTLRRIGSA